VALEIRRKRHLFFTFHQSHCHGKRSFFSHPERSAAGAKSRDRLKLPTISRSLDFGSLREPTLGMTVVMITATSE
jgi:hypothetical protein